MGLKASFGYACPSCGQDDHIWIQCDPAWSKLMAANPQDPEWTEWEDHGGHEWDDENPAECEDCQWAGTVSALAVTCGGPG